MALIRSASSSRAWLRTNATPELKRIAYPSRALLHHVSELVSEQLPALRRVRVIMPGGDVDAQTECEGERADGLSFGSDVNANIGEIGAKRRFHLVPKWPGQGLAAAAAEVREIRRQLEGPCLSPNACHRIAAVLFV